MADVVVTDHLHRFFPGLAAGRVTVDGATIAEVVRAVDALAPGFAGYVVTERGSLRPHVNLFIAGAMVIDRQGLSDPVPPGATIHVMQALSGG